MMLQKQDTFNQWSNQSLYPHLNPPNQQPPLALQNAKITSIDQFNEHNSIICRICWQKQLSKDDPLISLCKCSGSVGYTHYNCMKEWYKKFMFKQQTFYTDFYICREPICDLCKSKLPLNFIQNNVELNLLSIATPKQPHIMFQLKNIMKEIQIVCVKFPQDRHVIIGSSQDADLCFDDDLVNLEHAELKIVGQKIYIEDKGSRFGTLIKLRSNNKFNSEEGIKIKCKNLILKFSTQMSICKWFSSVQNYELKIQQRGQKDDLII